VPTATARSGACKRSSFGIVEGVVPYRTPRAADRCVGAADRGGLVFSGGLGSLLPAFDDTRACALADQLNNAVNVVPGHLYGETASSMSRLAGTARAGALARDADARAAEPDGGSALWVFALPGLISSELRLAAVACTQARPTLRPPGNTRDIHHNIRDKQARENRPNKYDHGRVTMR